MAKGKKSSAAAQEQYKKYQRNNQYSKNRVRNLTRHCKKFPEDLQAKETLERVAKTGFRYRRNNHASVSY